MSARLWLPRHLEDALWAHVARALPAEAVGVMSADADPASLNLSGAHPSGAPGPRLRALYPLRNVAAQPERQYRADPLDLLRALKAMKAEGLRLAAIYHSHPHGPARPSATDLGLAEYPVPYLIADVQRHDLRAYLLPQGQEVEVVRV